MIDDTPLDLSDNVRMCVRAHVREQSQNLFQRAASSEHYVGRSLQDLHVLAQVRFQKVRQCVQSRAQGLPFLRWLS